MQPRRFLALLISLAVFAGLAGPASADGSDRDGGGGGDANVVVDANADNNTLTVEVSGGRGAYGTVIRGPGLPGWLLACSWTTIDYLRYVQLVAGDNAGVDVAVVTAEDLIAAGEDPDEQWSIIFCDVGPEVSAIAPGILDRGILAAWPIAESPPAFVNEWIVAAAVASIDVPVQVGESAPSGEIDAPLITQLETWLWVDDLVWSPRTASAGPVFGTVATATATPYRVTFTGSDGQFVDCGANEGPVYDFGLPEDAQFSDCLMTFEHSSAVGDYTLSSTIYWRISWVCNQFCGAGTLATEFVITNTRPVRVAELQAIGTSTGNGS